MLFVDFREFSHGLRGKGGTEPKSSSGGESHPSALTEPDVRLSPHPAPIIQPWGCTASSHKTKSLGSRRSMRSNQRSEAYLRPRNRLNFRRAHAVRACLKARWRT